MNIGTNVDQWLKIQGAVLNEATRPLHEKATLPGERYPQEYSEEHQRNRNLFVNQLKRLCKEFDPDISADDFWSHCWEKIRYANMVADRASSEIDRLNKAQVFNDFTKFSESKWDVPEKPRNTPASNDAWGSGASDLLLKTGRFEDLQWYAKRDKLAKTIRTARAIAIFVEKEPTAPILSMLVDKFADREYFPLWQAHEKLQGFLGPITAIHVLMDLGLACIKPDIVVTKLMHKLGWFTPEGRAQDFTSEQIIKKYTDQRVYRAVIDAGIQIARSIPKDRLIIAANPVREFDFVMVKYGQKPEPSYGIVRNLHREWCPIEELVSN